MPGNAHDDMLGRRAIVAELQEALLPTALPVLPRARIAARYLVAGQEQAAGGDWFDAIPLNGGAVALVVGDVIGHGLSASAAMGQLRAVLVIVLTMLVAVMVMGVVARHEIVSGSVGRHYLSTLRASRGPKAGPEPDRLDPVLPPGYVRSDAGWAPDLEGRFAWLSFSPRSSSGTAIR